MYNSFCLQVLGFFPDGIVLLDSLDKKEIRTEAIRPGDQVVLLVVPAVSEVSLVVLWLGGGYSGQKSLGMCSGSWQKSCRCAWKKNKKKCTHHGWKQAEPNKRPPTMGAKET